MTDPGAAAGTHQLVPRGLIVVLSMAGLLVTVLALQQFANILAPVLLALVLVIGFGPTHWPGSCTGVVRRCGWR